MAVHIVTDSTCDIEPAEAQRLGIRVVPLTLHIGGEEFRDGVDITAEEFYRRLAAGGPQPSTSQPSPESFAGAYRSALREGADGVLSIHISSHWSGTGQSASLAAKEFGDRVVVVDSLSVSMGMQFLVRAALADAAAGHDLAEVAAATDERRARVRVLVLLDTLTYLQRGGRIGRAQAFLGGVLNVKPLLRLVDGEILPQARVRNRQQGVTKLLELLSEEGPLEEVGLMVGGTPELAGETERRLATQYSELRVRSGMLGPVVGTYAGPGAIGVAGLRAPG